MVYTTTKIVHNINVYPITQGWSQRERFQGFWNSSLSHLDLSLCQFLERPHCNTYHWQNSFWWFGILYPPPPLKNAGYAPVTIIILHPTVLSFLSPETIPATLELYKFYTTDAMLILLILSNALPVSGGWSWITSVSLTKLILEKVHPEHNTVVLTFHNFYFFPQWHPQPLWWSMC